MLLSRKTETAKFLLGHWLLPSGSSPHKDILRYPEISWDILRYPLIRISQDIFSGYLKDSLRISQRYLPRRYPQISFDIFIHIFLCIFLLIYVYLFAYPEISFFLSKLYPWYIFLFIFQYPWISLVLSIDIFLHIRSISFAYLSIYL